MPSLLILKLTSRASLGLDLNVKKTLHQPAPDETPQAPSIIVDGNILENMDLFPSLGDLLSTRPVINVDIHHHVGFASEAS